MDNAEWMAAVKEKYVFRYYGGLMTEQERLAFHDLIHTGKAEGYEQKVAQAEGEERELYLRSLDRLREGLSDDPNVLLLARDGLPAFILRTGQRILQDHLDQIVSNYCPRCSALARTPTAQQCRFCRHDWHNEAGPQTIDQQ